nr:class I adenylate-forming enzyme family protein [Micromonospora sp. DSM 115978]
MTYKELTGFDLLSTGSTAPEATEQPWLVRWDLVTDIERLVLDTLPDTLDFWTSGSTGPSHCWRRTREQLWAEAGLLADLLAADRPAAIVSFAPPRHVYGMLASVLVPAKLGLPVWYRPRYFGAMPPQELIDPAGTVTRLDRWAVVAVPWTFSILGRHRSWISAAERVAILHSSAMVPASAGDLLADLGPNQARIVEVFGSTESGGVATREWDPTDPPWKLFADVELVRPDGAGTPVDQAPVDGAPAEEVPLVIRSPRLAHRPGAGAPTTWQLDDYVEPIDERHYRFAGRRSRLVKVNGRRINLDLLEESLRAGLNCVDLAFVPVTDATSGEHLDLLVVAHPGQSLTITEVHTAVSRIEVRPRQVHLVDRIDRSDTGKLRRLQQPLTSDTGADS